MNKHTANVGYQLKKSFKNINADLKKLINKTGWDILNRNKSNYTRKLRSFVKSEYYDTFAESEYYERSFQFMKAAKCKPVKTPRGYYMEIYYDADNIVVIPPSKKGDFYSYGYSWASEEHDIGDYITDEGVYELYSELDKKAKITNKFIEWFEEDFNHKFYDLLMQRMKYLNK